MKLEVGMYVRTKDGIIDKVIIDYNGHCANPNCNRKHISCEQNYYDEEDVKKASFDITDLIEMGDVIKYRIDNVAMATKGYLTGIVDITDEEILKNIKENKNYHILQIETKEQFESMSYKLMENKQC